MLNGNGTLPGPDMMAAQALLETCMQAGRQIDVREVAAAGYSQANLAQAAIAALIDYLVEKGYLNKQELGKHLAKQYQESIKRMTHQPIIGAR